MIYIYLSEQILNFLVMIWRHCPIQSIRVTRNFRTMRHRKLIFFTTWFCDQGIQPNIYATIITFTIDQVRKCHVTYSLTFLGAVHKVCHAPRGEGVWESVTVCDRGGKDHVTSHFQFFHNSQFYVLFYIFSCINKFKLQLSPSEL